MNVSIRLWLKGGHHWEFVCDENDPMVFGLVSALPGATLDASLPADGLIQVEARNGQRLFLSRTSLVALTIDRLPANTRVPAGDGRPPREDTATFLAPTPFVMRADVFDRAAIEQITTAGAMAGSAENFGLQDVAIDALPETASDALVAVLSDASLYLLPEVGEDRLLDLGVRRVSGLAAVRLPWNAVLPRLLDFLIWMPGTKASAATLTVSLPDRWHGGGERPVTAPARTVPLAPNTALIFPATSEPTALDLQIAQGTCPATLVSGSLCQGSCG